MDHAAPGWDAINEVCGRLYPDQPEPLHYGTIIKWMLGGPDPLDGISIYRAETPTPHWHYVSYGLSDLYETDPPEDGSVSGYGFELTLRLADPAALDPQVSPPTWPLALLQYLARYVFTSGNVFAAGHHVGLNAALEGSRQVAVCFRTDSDFGEIETPRGRVSFLQVVPITDAELRTVQAWRTASFLELLLRRYPKAVCSLDRWSPLDDPDTTEEIALGLRRDGSSQSRLFVTHLRVEQGTVGTNGTDCTVLELGVAGAEGLKETLPLRLPFGRPLLLVGDTEVLFEPSDSSSYEISRDAGAGADVGAGAGALVVRLDEAAWQGLDRSLQSSVGEYPVPGLEKLLIRVVPDQQL